ncbi:hypothetical protein [Achromobacter denitrificans]|uniref:hypothetical protein n=1 Tax=Achromobacter denitrificans TaxID=32002 RepID=UPI0034A0C0D3
MNKPSQIFIIAGPNGAGKTSFAREFLPNEASCPVFVNADLIAAGLSPFAPEAAAMDAGRIMLAQIKEHVRKHESFAFETTSAMAGGGIRGRAHFSKPARCGNSDRKSASTRSGRGPQHSRRHYSPSI